MMVGNSSTGPCYRDPADPSVYPYPKKLCYFPYRNPIESIGFRTFKRPPVGTRIASLIYKVCCMSKLNFAGGRSEGPSRGAPLLSIPPIPAIDPSITRKSGQHMARKALDGGSTHFDVVRSPLRQCTNLLIHLQMCPTILLRPQPV